MSSIGLAICFFVLFFAFLYDMDDIGAAATYISGKGNLLGAGGGFRPELGSGLGVMELHCTQGTRTSSSSGGSGFLALSSCWH